MSLRVGNPIRPLTSELRPRHTNNALNTSSTLATVDI